MTPVNISDELKTNFKYGFNTQENKMQGVIKPICLN